MDKLLRQSNLRLLIRAILIVPESGTLTNEIVADHLKERGFRVFSARNEGTEKGSNVYAFAQRRPA